MKCWMTLVLSCLSPATAALGGESFDIVVYGGTSAGVVAAVQAARQGHSVVLIEPGTHLGGLTSGGLGFTDAGDKRVIGGLAREFYQRIKRYYEDPAAWVHEPRDQFHGFRPSEDAMWVFEPHVAELILEKLVAEHNIRVVRRQRLDRGQGVHHDGARIVAIAMESGLTFHGGVFIDATYEGDLMAAAGVSYTVGRESSSTYQESLNGVQTARNVQSHRFLRPVDPYQLAGNPSSGLLPGIEPEPPPADGTGDRRIQAYCFRMCMSNVPANRVPFPKPADYDQQRYEILLRNFEAGDLRLPLKIDRMPNGKTDTNNNGAFSTDYLGANYDYPEATYDQREAIVRDHVSYQQGLMWTLANHPRVPERIRAQMADWGLARDEFVDNDHWPRQLYVREARRMIGAYVITESDCRRQHVAPDSVGLGSYNMDSHNVQRYRTRDGYVQNEGDVEVSPGGAYVVPYRALTPRRDQCPNLLVPVCLSASHIAYGSIRMEPVFMVLGQSSAAAAALALEAGVPVQDVAYSRLRERLLADGQVLDLPPSSREMAR